MNLAKSAAGCRAYLQHKRLVNMIDEATLNSISVAQDDKGSSLVFWLLLRPEGVAVIEAYPHLLQQLQFGTCFSEVEAGEMRGESIASLLRRKEHAALLNLLSDELHEVVRLSVPNRDAIQEQELLAARHRFFTNRYPLPQEDEVSQKRCILM